MPVGSMEQEQIPSTREQVGGIQNSPETRSGAQEAPVESGSPPNRAVLRTLLHSCIPRFQPISSWQPSVQRGGQSVMAGPSHAEQPNINSRESSDAVTVAIRRGRQAEVRMVPRCRRSQAGSGLPLANHAHDVAQPNRRLAARLAMTQTEIEPGSWLLETAGSVNTHQPPRYRNVSRSLSISLCRAEECLTVSFFCQLTRLEALAEMACIQRFQLWKKANPGTSKAEQSGHAANGGLTVARP